MQRAVPLSRAVRTLAAALIGLTAFAAAAAAATFDLLSSARPPARRGRCGRRARGARVVQVRRTRHADDRRCAEPAADQLVCDRRAHGDRLRRRRRPARVRQPRPQLKIVALCGRLAARPRIRKVDAVISNVTVTEERKQKFDFSTYRKDQAGFYVRNDSKIHDPRAEGRQAARRDRRRHQPGKILLAWDRETSRTG